MIGASKYPNKSLPHLLQEQLALVLQITKHYRPTRPHHLSPVSELMCISKKVCIQIDCFTAHGVKLTLMQNNTSDPIFSRRQSRPPTYCRAAARATSIPEPSKFEYCRFSQKPSFLRNINRTAKIWSSV